MNNAEETTETGQKRSSYVDDFLESGRKKAKTSLSTQDEKHIKDLEYMLKSVRALVKIINEIWDSCEDHLTSSEENKSPFTFQRRIYKEVEVRKKGRNLTITTEKLSNTKDFGNLPSVPEDLSKMVCFDPPESENEILPDYNRYIEKSSILCKDVLLPFLTGFKEHLENVQVYLGQIEAWLLEPKFVDSFLKKTFNGPGCKRMKDENDPSKILLFSSYCLHVDPRIESTFDICTEVGREVLKATANYIKVYKPVIQIEVKDAGEKAVNGTYTLNGISFGVYRYTCSGLWNGKPVTFCLYRLQDKKRWIIYCRDASKNCTFFYWAEATGEECELPPMNGWRIGVNNFNGVNPPPQILYIVA